MLDMGFEEAIREIVGKTPPKRQSLLFSATYPEAIRAMARATLRDPVEVTVADAIEQPAVEQLFFEVDLAHKPAALAALLLHYRPESSVVFCNTRRDTQTVVDALAEFGIAALALHGDIEQRDRDEVLVRFANRSCSVLVASDVAARGLDIKDLGAVINYELPTDLDTYLHRIGRTGRAGRSGLALSLCTPREMPRALALEKQQGARAALAESPAARREGEERIARRDGHAAHRRRPHRQDAPRRRARRADRRRGPERRRGRQDRRVRDAFLCGDRARPRRQGAEPPACRQDQGPQFSYRANLSA